jgi:hypothetical protein
MFEQKNFKKIFSILLKTKSAITESTGLTLKLQIDLHITKKNS